MKKLIAIQVAIVSFRGYLFVFGGVYYSPVLYVCTFRVVFATSP